MAGQGLDYSTLFNKDLPPPAGRWQGHPKYNFIGGHSDPELEPMEQFIESAVNVFRGDPRNISMYNFDGGPQGIIPLRRFVVQKLAAHRGIHVTPDEVLITSGSGQAIHLINNVLLEEGDTVVLVLQRLFKEGCSGRREVRLGAWRGSAGPVRYYPAYPPTTSAIQQARTVPEAASPAPPGRPAAS